MDETTKNDRASDSAKASRSSSFPIVGIGASAGGVAALTAFVTNIAADSGCAYVVVQHLDPDHKSSLASILQRHSAIETKVVEDEAPIEPNKVYVIPPASRITIKGGLLHLAKSADVHTRRMPIDEFLVSLALEHGEDSACVILSGTGSDGTVGLQAIKGHGGLTLAQEGAEYDGMMRSAVATGLVDIVLPVEQMPATISNYFSQADKVRERKGPDDLRREVSDQLSRIAVLLRERTGHDFSGYKDNTIIRRIQRRMQVLQVDSIEEFHKKLRKEPQELDFLFQDLLIGVTSFFRDPEQFEALEREVVPKLFEGKGLDDVVRVWVPGCSTGEETYSIAMLLREQMGKNHGGPKLQIFASDIDERALEIARIGRYPASVAENVSPSRLRRFFSREDGTYRVNSELREICLFSAHNILRDPPFSRQDLISCRNLLIYLGADLQERVIPLFHYALRDGGYLFLGSSENITRHGRLFSTVDKANRLFQKRPRSGARLPEFPLTARVRVPQVNRARDVNVRASFEDMAERELLDRYAPAYVIVNDTGDLIHSSGGTGKYLELPRRAPDHNIFTMARSGLRLNLRSVLSRAIGSGRVSIQKDISVGTNGGRQTIDLVVQPLRRDGDTVYMLVFRDKGVVRPEKEPEESEADDDVVGGNVRQLEEELRATKERLQTTTEELESSNEELKSANEELSSINEELQSSNEELETSKEELQSINEELQTVNSELNARVEELSRANSDVSNLLESTQIATVFLDQGLCVKSFTPASKELFRLVESDVGRPLSHVRARFASDTLQADAEQVLRKLGTVERQIDDTESGSRYMMRILPYRTIDNVIAGVVITFVDVTQITLAEERIKALSQSLRNRVENLETLLELVPVGILIAEDSGSETTVVNRHGAELLGRQHGEEKLLSIPMDLPLEREGRRVQPDEQPLRHVARTGQPVPAFEGRIERDNCDGVDVLMSANPLFNEAGEVRGAIAAMIDITFRKKAEARQQLLLHELQHRVKNIIATITGLASRMLWSSTSPEEFSAAFLQRLQAMGRTHDLLSRRAWEGTELKDVIEAALLPYAASDQERFTLDDPRVFLTPNAAGTFGLVFFELASNAAKYGALSAEHGHVDIRWEVSSGDLLLRWQEVGGPPVKLPVKMGFGTTFVQQSLEYEAGGKVDLTFEKHGMACAMKIPIARLGAADTE